MNIDPKLLAITASLEAEIYRHQLTIGKFFPFLSMATEFDRESQPNCPLISRCRSAAHALRREGFRLNSPLISKPAPGDRDLVLAWCRETGRGGWNDHWASMRVTKMLDEFLYSQAALRSARPVSDLQITENMKAEFMPSFCPAAPRAAPQILQIVPL